MQQFPKGVYDQLVTVALRQALESIPATLDAHFQELSDHDVIEYISREVADRIRVLLKGSLKGDDAANEVMRIANNLLGQFDGGEAEQKVLTRIASKIEDVKRNPLLPLSQSTLITNDQDLNYHQILRDELSTADRVDLICPFIGMQGLNLILSDLQNLGGKLRVITTTYLGGTHVDALAKLAKFGAQIKIVFESKTQKTSLHAKAWIFHRDSGFTTATIGSSNLSPRALVDGLEWNVRLGSKDAFQVLQGLTATFDRHWADSRFEPFDVERDYDTVRDALESQRSDQPNQRIGNFLSIFDLKPYPHQIEALESLQYARLDGQHNNLVVAATGTGKTLLAAFDYERLAKSIGGRPSLLFVAHREEILEQSLFAFRTVLRDGNFAELNVGKNRAKSWKHVFASVQSLSHKDLTEFESDHFDVIVIDEFHHAESPTYTKLVNYFQPRELLGLTATPERADGKQEIIEKLWPPTFELRLWHALERQLLCPFHYFGIDDSTDLGNVGWVAGKYDVSGLEEVLVTKGQKRSDVILRELQDKVDLASMQAVSFCASIKHANYMNSIFQEFGLTSEVLHSKVPDSERESIISKFRSGKTQMLCTVDLFNEGVDIPEINTVLFLRPTESATIFIQQLGRGLRNHPDKGALTVLDFVGQQNRDFRMDLRYRALTGMTRSQLQKAVSDDFPRLPPGCDIRLDSVTTDRVLENLRKAVPTNIRELAMELRRLSLSGQIPTVGRFIDETGIEVSELYKSNRSYLQIKQTANLISGDIPVNHKRIGAVSHVDDKHRLKAYAQIVREGNTNSVYGRMLSFPLLGHMRLDELDILVKEEVGELMDFLLETAVARPLVADDLPFCLHSHYTRDEIVAPFRDNPVSMRQGTFYSEAFGLDIHLFTLNKSERDFSATTRYNDWFESPDVIHWESQSTTSIDSRTGQRLVNGTGRHLFFVREQKDEPFFCLGFAVPISYTSEKPIKLRWKLEHLVPDHLYLRFKAAAG